METSMENAIKKKREELDDDNFENLLTLFSHYIFTEVEEIIPFNERTDDQREEISKVVTKSMETMAVLLFELIPNGSVDTDKLRDVVGLLKQEKFKEAHKALCESP